MKSPLFAVLVCMVAACHASSWVGKYLTKIEVCFHLFINYIFFVTLLNISLDTVYTSTLSGNQVVPDPGSATAHSQAIIVFDRFTNVSYSIRRCVQVNEILVCMPRDP